MKNKKPFAIKMNCSDICSENYLCLINLKPCSESNCNKCGDCGAQLENDVCKNPKCIRNTYFNS